MTTRQHAIWHLQEADRLDKAAAAWTATPEPVASTSDMTADWVEATLGPEQLRRIARQHRITAAALARKANRR